MAVPDQIVRELADFAKWQLAGIRVPEMRNAILDHAFDDLGFDGDQEELWQQVRSEIEARQVGNRGGEFNQPQGGRGREAAIRRDDCSDLITAPYRFVELGERIVDPEAEAKGPIDTPIPTGFCAEIEVEWAAETPLLIGEQDGNAVVPMTLNGATDWVIPGASLRGMMRAALEIIAYGRLSQVNRHLHFGVRDFEHYRYTIESAVSRVNDVRAGWLTRNPSPGGDESDYQISECEWAMVEIDTLIAALGCGGDRRTWIGRGLQEKYRLAGMKSNGSVEFGTARRFRDLGPGGDDDGSAKGKNRAALDPSGKLDGVLVVSDKLPGQGNKRYEYMLHDVGNTPTPVSQQAYALFRELHSRRTRNQLQPDGTWEILKPIVDSGGRIPVFYVGDLAKQEPRSFAFGLTRLFKVPHKFTVGDILSRQSGHALTAYVDNSGDVEISADFVENLFGYVFERAELEAAGHALPKNKPLTGIARKGRIAFSFARPNPGQALRAAPHVNTVMMGARASFAPFYLRGNYKDYSDEKSLLAGRKRYLPRYPQDRCSGAASEIRNALARQHAGQGADMTSRLRFLVPASEGQEMRFTSRIRLHNVTAAELGAVLWALTHGGKLGQTGKPYRHMLGHAKPFGAGQVRVASARLAVEPNIGHSDLVRAPTNSDMRLEGMEDFYPLENGNDWRLEENACHNPFLSAFTQYMKRQPGLDAWPSVRPVREFLGSCRPDFGHREAEGNRLAHMPLGSFARVRKMTKLLRIEGTPPYGPDRYLAAPDDVSAPSEDV